MKARLAKKIFCTPINWLAPHWRNNIFCSDRRDARIEKAIAKWNKRKQRISCEK